MAEATATDDMADGIKQLLECPVCLERFTNPKSLPCQHTFCKTCLEALIFNGNKIRCPQCRAVHIISAHGISGLSTIFTIVSLMDISPNINDCGNNTRLKLSLKHTCAGCATETIQSDLTACPHCGDIICPVCSVSHFTEMKESLFKTAHQIHSDVGRIYDVRNKLEVGLGELMQKSEDIKTEIGESVETFILEIREKQNRLCQQVDVYINEASSSLQSKIACLEAELASRLSLSVAVDSAMAKILSNMESDIDSLMSISVQCSDYNDEDHENLLNSFQNRTNPNVNFVPINAEELRESILKFGEITTETRKRNLGDSTEGSAMLTTCRGAYHERQGKVLIDENNSGGFSVPIGIALSPTADRIYVTDIDNNTLQIFDESGRHIKTVHAPGGVVGEFNWPTGITVNDNCDVMVSDTHNHCIVVFNREGEYRFSFGEQGANDGQLNGPRGLAVDVACNVYVCDRNNHRVQVFNHEGMFIRKFTQPATVPGAFNPVHLAIDHGTDRVFITDLANHRVQVYSTGGEYLSCFGSRESADAKMNSPYGICVDNEGYIILGDGDNRSIQVFLMDGTFHCQLGSVCAERTQLSYPRGLAVDKNNRVFVVDAGHKRVIVF